MGLLLKFLMKLASGKFLKPLEIAYENPYEAQEKVLRKIVDTNRNTIFGKKYDFDNIFNIETYQTKVPLLAYSDYKPFINEILKGTSSVLNHETTVHLAQTSGTTGSPKILPLSKNSIKEFGKISGRIFASYINEDPENKKILDGKFLLFMAPAIDYTINDLPVGYISGINAIHQNKLFQKMVIPSNDILNEKDWNLKFYKTAQVAIKNNITLAGGVTPLLLSLIQKITDDLDNPVIHDYLTSKESNESLPKIKNLSKIWPNFKVLLHSGVKVKPYLNWMNELFDEVVDFRDNYGATEGVFGFQMGNNQGMHLNLDTYFFEFVEESDMNKEIPKRYLVDQLRVGKNYAIVITSSNGLYSYIMSDIIKIKNIDPLLIDIVGRKGHEISLAGEKMTDEKLSNAIYDAMKINGAQVREFTVIPVFDGGLRYRFLIEFKKPPQKPIQFLRDLDDSLSNHNKIYHQCRDMSLIDKPELIILPNGTYQQYGEMKAAQGKPIGQMKTPHIANEDFKFEKVYEKKPIDILTI